MIAVCLSDKRIIFLNFETDNGIELLYEITLPILEKRIWFLKYHNIWVTSGSKLPDFDFFTLNELDIELQNDGQKYEFLYNEGHPYRTHYTTKSSFHLSEILDCIEIMKPLLVLTACMDGKIRLISIETQNVLKIWNYHKLGVRQLDYNPYLDGGYVLSVGFEYFINFNVFLANHCLRYPGGVPTAAQTGKDAIEEIKKHETLNPPLEFLQKKIRRM